MTELRGRGPYVVDADATVARLRVSPGQGARLRADALLGWEGAVEVATAVASAATMEAAGTPPFVHVTGDGVALVEMLASSERGKTDMREVSGWGRFEVLQQLDRTATDELLLARARGPGGFERTVVLKRHFMRCEEGSPYLHRLAREALAYELLAHPSIVRLYDFLLLDGQPVFVFECVRGVSLARLVRRLEEAQTPFPDHVALYVAHGVFSALAAAHQARRGETGEFAPVIHRDVHPRNVLLTWSGEVKLANFALAKIAGAPEGLEHTLPGTLRGTYGYMAPEQALGDYSTVRTDVYAASVVLWELLARRPAFAIDGLPELEVLQAMASPHLPPITDLRPEVPPAIAEALAQGLAPNADDRHVTASDFVRLLEETADMRAARDKCIRMLAWVRSAEQADTDETGAFAPQRASITPSTPLEPMSVPPAPPVVPSPTIVVSPPAALDVPVVPSPVQSLQVPPTPVIVVPAGPPSVRSPAAFSPAESFEPPALAYAPTAPAFEPIAPASVPPVGMSVPPTPPWVVPSYAPVTRTEAPRRAPSSPVPLIAAAAAGVLVLGTATTWGVARALAARQAAAARSGEVQPTTSTTPVDPTAAPASVDPPASSTAAAGTASAGSPAPTEEPAPATTATTTATGTAATPSASASDVAATPPVDGSHGTMLTGSSAEHHRVFFDGRVVGEGEGSFVVPCGAHVVRIGSAGQDRNVVVPCGGSVDLR